jgi:hypothetical protein
LALRDGQLPGPKLIGTLSAEFERLRAAIDEAIAHQHASRAAGDSQGSIADELAKLAALRDQGVITDADFEAGKAKLLGTS